MENYNSSTYPYGDPYRYPPPSQPGSDPYRYPPPPQQGSDPYPPPHASPIHHYPYNPSYSFSYPQPQPPPSAYSTHSGPIDYQYSYPPPANFAPPVIPPGQSPYPSPYPDPSYPPSVSQCPARPSLQYHSSFHYDSSTFYPPTESNPPHHSRANSFPGYQKQDSSLSSTAGSPKYNAAYGSAANNPPLEYSFDKLNLSDNVPSAPPSPTTFQQSVSTRYSQRTDMYGSPNNSFSSNNVDPSSYAPRPAYVSSSSFNGSQHGQALQIVPVTSPKGSLRFMLLHGNLDIWVYEAKNLPNMDMFHKTLTDVFGKRLPGSVTNKVEGHAPKVTSDPYVTVSVANAVVGRTYVISNNENPVWTQHFNVPVAHHASEIHFVVKDSDVVGSQIIGVVAIPVEHAIAGNRIEGSFPVLNMSNRKPCKPGAELRLSLQYIPIERLTAYHHGVGSGPNYTGVPGTYFPLRQGGKVTLYQDAHVPDGFLPSLKLDEGVDYEHGKCWYDIMNAILQARRLIYITGWSVYHNVKLVRDSPHFPDCTLGELLKTKSQEGVRVLLLIWDDPTSRSILGYQTKS
ncbi:Phospholipase d beta [Thalictrum thalictroides]|uniref:Phospholipase d beta n=1 Tax=Thalictrum thalictroides TaxID=46969 RepID=A0A7J6V235_THATH|nr:Phospholipase d beta [Thalictrum thalictroides]